MTAEWPDARRLRVLIVDDDKGVRESLGEVLEGKWKVLIAGSGEEALALCAEQRPEILLSDQRMAPMEGLAFFEKAKAIVPRARRLLMTGYADLEAVVRGLNRDLFHRYITKPWKEAELHAMLDEAAQAYLADVDRFALVERHIQPLRARLLEHRVYGMMTHARAMRIFMQYHCFAVWDFMALLKRLQQKLTCVEVPWRTPDNMFAARMVNEIVVAEETDHKQDHSGFISHFDMYVDAMAEVGAETDTLRRFTDLIQEGMEWRRALTRAGVPAAAAAFVTRTLEVCEDHPAYEVASYFLFGRENLIPDMFRKIIEGIAAGEGLEIGAFRYYMDRHIGIDEEEHGPASQRMMRALCGTDDARWRLVLRAAEEALLARIGLWDGIAEAIQKS